MVIIYLDKDSTGLSQSRKEAEREVKGSRAAGQSYSRSSESPNGFGKLSDASMFSVNVMEDAFKNIG